VNLALAAGCHSANCFYNLLLYFRPRLRDYVIPLCEEPLHLRPVEYGVLIRVDRCQEGIARIIPWRKQGKEKTTGVAELIDLAAEFVYKLNINSHKVQNDRLQNFPYQYCDAQQEAEQCLIFLIPDVNWPAERFGSAWIGEAGEQRRDSLRVGCVIGKQCAQVLLF